MAVFKFKLEPVLKQRRAIEDERQRDLAKLLRRKMILEGQLRQMQETITESKHALSDTLVGKVDLDRVSHFARYSGQATFRAQQIVMELHRTGQDADAARARLIGATRDRRAMELLRERYHKRWKRDQARREAVAMDEIATQRYLRGQAIRIAS